MVKRLCGARADKALSARFSAPDCFGYGKWMRKDSGRTGGSKAGIDLFFRTKANCASKAMRAFHSAVQGQCDLTMATALRQENAAV